MCLTVGAQVNAQQRVPGQFNVPWGNYLTTQPSQVLSPDGQWRGIPIAKGEGRHMRHMERNLPSGAKWTTPSHSKTKRSPINEPDQGVQEYYRRSGMAYYYSDGYIYQTSQSGHVAIVESEDGTVFIKDIVSHFEAGT